MFLQSRQLQSSSFTLYCLMQALTLHSSQEVCLSSFKLIFVVALLQFCLLPEQRRTTLFPTSLSCLHRPTAFQDSESWSFLSIFYQDLVSFWSLQLSLLLELSQLKEQYLHCPHSTSQAAETSSKRDSTRAFLTSTSQ